MPAYSFKGNFVEDIRAGRKKQTIRRKRKGQAKPGSRLYLFIGMRTKWCQKIGEADCTSVHEIVIYMANRVVTIDGRKLEPDELEELAKADGFLDWRGMHRWWVLVNGYADFYGDVIKWAEIELAPMKLNNKINT